MSYKEDLKKRSDEIEEILADYAPKGDSPALLLEAMRYSLFAGGKRMRPVLLMEAVRLFDGPVMLARPLAAALEMIHTYSLIHDDLPAMDDDVLRRGKATNHVVFGEAMAILAGDGLLNCAMQIMVQNIPYENIRYLEGYLRAMTEIIVAAGHEGMIGGQALDVLSEGKGADKEALDYIHKHKTGALLTAPLRAGALLSGADEEQLAAVSAYAATVGHSFQLVDDLLDIEGEAEKLGKSIGKDAADGKLTYPGVHGIEATRTKIVQLHQQAVKNLKMFGDKGDFLKRTADFLAERDH